MRYLSYEEVVALHRLVVAQSGGSDGIRDEELLKSAVAQPEMAFGGNELYPTVTSKAGSLGFSLIQNHPFVDGNKRIGHAAASVFLRLNGWELSADVDEQERVILKIASGQMPREEFSAWIERHSTQRNRDE